MKAIIYVSNTPTARATHHHERQGITHNNVTQTDIGQEPKNL
jgi:hypothetical protein